MTSEADRWQHVRQVFQATLDRPEADRARFLREACPGDSDLRRDVESLLDAHVAAGERFMDKPAIDGLGASVADRVVEAARTVPGRSSAMQRIATGTRIGVYDILGPLGEGGMGVVYRAHDTKLGRDVALKILPEVFAADPDRLARFQREAQVLASLNHPNIGHIYGVEESAGVRALVLELVEGPTLADRIAGAIPFDEVLLIARQVAEALEAAHEHGVIHRDLKPANIKVRPDGAVKVLDFGLAKAMDPLSSSSAAATTLTGPAATSTGVILGTAAYMSPEQARGKAVDRRGDVWAFGCVLYEMLVGRQAFPGETVSDTLVRILEREPDWQALPAGVPPKIRALLERCLRKEARRRLPDIAEARIEIEEARTEPPASTVEALPSRRLVYGSAVVALMSLLAAASLAVRTFLAPASEVRTVQFDVVAPGDGSIVSGQLSPDGRRLAFVVGRARDLSSRDSPFVAESTQSIWVRSLDSSIAQMLSGTQGAARNIFWSADSQYLGFFANGQLRKIAAGGGPAQVICNLPVPGEMSPTGWSGAWSAEQVILIGGQLRRGLFRVSAAGGEPSPATELDAKELVHDSPTFLPDNRHFLYMSRVGYNTANDYTVYVGALDSKVHHRLPVQSATSATYSPTGHVLFGRGGTLMAQPLDVNRLELSGEAFPIAGHINQYVTTVSASVNGSLAYWAEDVRDSQLIWFDRTGKPLAIAGPKGEYNNPELSPDARFVAFDRGDPPDIWWLDIEKGIVNRFTTDPASEYAPLWSPDGRTIAFYSDRKTPQGSIYLRAFGAVEEDRLLRDGSPNDWSRDGRYLAYEDRSDLWALPLMGDPKPIRLTETPFRKSNARISPDGHWIAYESDETGGLDVFVQSFPQRGRRQQVSNGGRQPHWSRNGKELFFVAPDFTLMAASVKPAGASMEVGASVPLFRTHMHSSGADQDYSVAADGRFLINVDSAALPVLPITVILNWQPAPGARDRR